MTEFGAAATLTIEEVNGVQAAFDRDVELSVGAGGSRKPSQRKRGSGIGDAGGMGGQSLTALAEDRNEILNEIHDVLEDSGGPGGGAGAGAGIGLRALGGAGSILGMVGAGIGAGRFALGEGLFGDEGLETITRRMKFEGVDGIENAMDEPAKALANGFVNSIDPTGIGETMARKFGSAAESEIRDVVPQQFVTEFDETVGTLDSALSNPPDPLDDAQWPDVPDLSAEADWPELPSLSNEVDWPALPELFGDQPNSSGSGQTPAMQLDGSQPTTSSTTSSTGNGLQALDVNVDGEIDVDDARAVEEQVREFVSQELQRQFRGP